MVHRSRSESCRQVPGPTCRPFIVGLVALLLLIIEAAPLTAQNARPAWNGTWRISTRAQYDSNVFRLTDSQGQALEATGEEGRFADMSRVSDLVVRATLRGSVRGRGLAARRLEIGGAVKLDAYMANSRLTHVSLATFASQSLTSRDQLTVELGYRPDEFRRNYLAGAGASGAPVYAAGVAARTRARVTYARDLRKGSRHDLALEVSLEGGRRTIAGFAWRDRNELDGQAKLRAELSRRVDGELTLGRGRGSYDGTPEPFMEGIVVSTTSLQRDFTETELGLGLRLDLRHRRKLVVGWERRIRSFNAALGEDPVYGDRRDDRDTFEAEYRHDLHGPLEMRFGGSYRTQNTFRPARGDTTDEADYRRTRLFVSLRYAR